MDLNINNEELDALKTYKNKYYEAMNQMLVSDAEVDIALLSDEIENKVVEISYGRENVIQNILNLKSIYKLFMKSYHTVEHKSRTLYRGTNLAEVDRIKAEPYIDRILSTTLIKNEAEEKYASQWSQPAELIINLEEDIPLIYVKNYFDKCNDENEILVSPFTKVKEFKFNEEKTLSNGKKVRIYEISLEKQKLDRLTDMERNGLFNYILENCYSIKKKIQDCIKLEKENVVNFENIRRLEQVLTTYENDENSNDDEENESNIERVNKQLSELKEVSNNVFDIRKNNITFINNWKKNVAVYMIAEAKEIERKFDNVEYKISTEIEGKNTEVQNTILTQETKKVVNLNASTLINESINSNKIKDNVKEFKKNNVSQETKVIRINSFINEDDNENSLKSESIVEVEENDLQDIKQNDDATDEKEEENVVNEDDLTVNADDITITVNGEKIDDIISSDETEKEEESKESDKVEEVIEKDNEENIESNDNKVTSSVSKRVDEILENFRKGNTSTKVEDDSEEKDTVSENNEDTLNVEESEDVTMPKANESETTEVIDDNELHKKVKSEIKDNIDLTNRVIENINTLITNQQNHARIAENLGANYSALNNAFEMRSKAESLLKTLDVIQEKIKEICNLEYDAKNELQLERISLVNNEVCTLLNYLNNPKIVANNANASRFEEIEIIEENELKRGIARKVRDIIGECHLKLLKDDIQIIKDRTRFQRFIGFFTGENKRDVIRLEQITIRENAIKKSMTRRMTLAKNYSIHDMMADINMLLSEYGDDELLENEVEQLAIFSNEIRKNYIISDSKIQQIIDEREGKFLPVEGKVSFKEDLEIDTYRFLKKYKYDISDNENKEPIYQDTIANEIGRIIEYINTSNII